MQTKNGIIFRFSKTVGRGVIGKFVGGKDNSIFDRCRDCRGCDGISVPLAFRSVKTTQTLPDGRKEYHNPPWKRLGPKSEG